MNQSMSTAAPITAPIRVVRVRQVALPVEHGGWAFLLEPLIAGLAIAYSTGAPWIACLTIGAFLTRQPLKVLIADRFGMRNRERVPGLSIFALLRCDILHWACWYAPFGRRPVATPIYLGLAARYFSDIH